MATVAAIIDALDLLKPNAFSSEQKLTWLSALEGEIQKLLLHTPEAAVRKPYRLPQDGDVEALVLFPHDRIYGLYLGAMVDFANGEYTNYQNSMIMFNNAYLEYAKAFVREHGFQGKIGTLRVL